MRHITTVIGHAAARGALCVVVFASASMCATMSPPPAVVPRSEPEAIRPDLFVRTVFFSTAPSEYSQTGHVSSQMPGGISDVRYGYYHGKSAKCVALVGFLGSAWVTVQGSVIHSQSFEAKDWQRNLHSDESGGIGIAHFRVVDAEGDGNSEYFSVHGINPILLNHDGDVTWRKNLFADYGSGGFDAAFGDTDNDGQIEFLIEDTSARKTIMLVDGLGDVIWLKRNIDYRDWLPAPLFSETSPAGPGFVDTLHGAILYVNKSGTVGTIGTLYPLSADTVFMSCSVLRYPTPDGPPHFFGPLSPRVGMPQTAANRGYALYSIETGKLTRFISTASSIGFVESIRVVTGRLEPDGPNILAVCSWAGYQGRKWAGFETSWSILQVFDENGALLYCDEIPDSEYPAIEFVDNSETGESFLLMAAGTKVYKYTPNKTVPNGTE